MKVDAEFMASVRNAEVLNSFVKAEKYLAKHERVLCSVSGGADSDIVVDMLTKLDDEHKITYVWFNTGVEYQATKDHLASLEQKYGITIEREDAVMPIPSCCKKYGQPLLSKDVSAKIENLQRHDFQWEDGTYKELVEKYPKCKTAISWWTNNYAKKHPEAKPTQWNILRYPYLKEFMLQNPPTFRVSAKCCDYAKKRPSALKEKEMKADMLVLGIRKAEGGNRAIAYKTCYGFDQHRGLDSFRPLFWYTQADKDYYCERFGVTHSKCYTQYGMKRTGCTGCPFNHRVIDELTIIQQYEPKLYKACTNIFADSYEYTRRYREFVKMMKAGGE